MDYGYKRKLEEDYSTSASRETDGSKKRELNDDDEDDEDEEMMTLR